MTVELELPAVWIDQVVLDDLGLPLADPYLQLINKFPEPDQEVIPRATLISFDLTGSSFGSGDVFVWISVDGSPEVVAYDSVSGIFQPGWDGPGSALSILDANTVRFVIDPTSDFTSLQEVTVRVSATTGASGVPSINEPWTFTIEDLTAPVVVSARATSKSQLLLFFDEPINQTQAVTPGNYTITRLAVPAVDVVVETAGIDTTNSVILDLDIEMTPGVEYRIQVAGVEDLLGNLVAAPFDTTTFTGFQPTVPDGRRWDMWMMVPRINRDEDPGDLRKFVDCLQEVQNLLLCLIDEWTKIIDPDQAPEAFVDAILADLGNPFSFDLSLTDKRRLVRILVPIYQQKGTGIGIINAVRFFLGVEVTIVAFASEGWLLGEDELGDSVTDGTAILGPGTTFGLYSFEVVSPITLTADQRVRIKELADYMKPAHTHCIRIVEPTIPEVIDHLELGLSELGDTWLLH